MKGDLIGLKVNGAYIECETSCDLSFDQEMLPASNPETGRWRAYIAGARGWSASLNANTILNSAGMNIGAVLQAFIDGTPVTLTMRTKEWISPEVIIEGDALITSGSFSSAARSDSTWNTTFTGTGGFTYSVAATNSGFGYTSTDPLGNETSLVPQFSQNIDSPNPTLNFTTGSAGSYLFVKVPSGLSTTFTEWYSNGFNFGAIPDAVWRSPVTVDDFTYYMTRVPVYFTSDSPTIQFS